MRTHHHWLALLTAVILLVTAACPAVGQETGEPYMTEQAFGALVRGAFPHWQANGGAEATLTYARALAMLCEALGLGGDSPA